MKNLLDLVSQKPSNIIPPVTPPPVDTVADPVTETDLPEYLFTDPEISGYPDELLQTDVYNMSFRGNLPILGGLSIIDVGCKRGDVCGYLRDAYPNLTITYTGYETNPMLVEVGSKKLADVSATASIIGEDFLGASIDSPVDVVAVIGSLNVNDGWNYKPWEQFELTVRKALEVAREKVIITVMHSSDGVDQYVSYPLPNAMELIVQLNHPFTVNFGKVPGMYTIVIDCSTKNFLI